MLTVALVSDLHFGPEARFDGKLRKLTAQAEALTQAFVRRMNEDVRPDLVINLGDDIEDESHEADLSRYRRAVSVLGESRAEVRHVAGNHDLVNLGAHDLLGAWGHPVDGELFYSFDRGGVHFTVLHTRERKDVDVTVGAEQLAWLEADLASTRLPVVALMHHSAADQDLRGNRWFERAAHICLIQERRRLREILERSGRVLAVLNGHLHWNHLDVIGGIPYVTLQSLVENVDDDAPGRPAAACAILRIQPRRLVVEVEGAERARYQIERATEAAS